MCHYLTSNIECKITLKPSVLARCTLNPAKRPFIMTDWAQGLKRDSPHSKSNSGAPLGTLSSHPT